MRSLRHLLDRRHVSIAASPAGSLPPELHWRAGESVWLAVKIQLGRRRFLQGLLVAIAALMSPLGRVRRASATGAGKFFTHEELTTLAALCDILDCTPNDLIEIEAVNAGVRKAAGQAAGPVPAVRRTSIRRPEGL